MFSYEVNLVCDGVGCDGIEYSGIHDDAASARAEVKDCAVKAGWAFKGRRHLCPDCAKKEEASNG